MNWMDSIPWNLWTQLHMNHIPIDDTQFSFETKKNWNQKKVCDYKIDRDK